MMKLNKAQTQAVLQLELEFCLNTAQIGFWKLNLETKKAECSLLHDQIFGYPSGVSDWTYETFLSHVHPDDKEWVDHEFHLAIAGIEPWNFECRIYRKNDHALRWIRVSGQVLNIGHKKLRYMLGLIQDITKRKNTELKLSSTNAKFKTLLNATPDALIICDAAGKIILSNHNTKQVFGYTQQELLGQSIESLIPERYTQQHQKHRQHYFKHPQTRPMGTGLDLYAKHKDGHEFPAEISLSPIHTDDGLIAIASIRDITERKKIEDAKAMLSALVEGSDEAIIGKNLEGIIFSWNHAAELLYGYKADEIIGKSIQILFPQDKKDEFEMIIHQIMHGEHIKHKESIRMHKDGHLIPVSITISPIMDSHGKIIGASTTAQDITEQKQIEEKLRHLAEHDPLTGLINRPLFEDRLIQAINLAKRHKDHLAVLFIDLDNFKQVNDTYGHAIGNLVLCAVADCMKKSIRSSDSLARFGGDEFASILSDIKDENQVLKIVKKIASCVTKGYMIENKQIQVSVSIGIAMYPRNGEEQLIEKADRAMYYVKSHGKNNYKLFDDSLDM